MARILIVDDDPALLNALPEAVRLRMQDAQVDTCDSAREALARIGDVDYDAIVASLTRAVEERARRRRVEEQQAFLEQHAELLERIVEERTRELRETNRLKDRFIAMLSHELRSPLSAIRMWASLLRGGTLDAERTQRAIEAIERSAITQARLVEELLDMSRITVGKLVLDARPVDLVVVAEAALDAVRAEAEAKEVQLERDFGLGGARLQGDPARLQQIIWN